MTFRFEKTHLAFGIRAAVVVVILMAAATPVWSDDLSKLAEQLISLRGDVEGLSARLEDNKSVTRDQLRSLARQKADIEAQIQREKLRIQQLRQTLETQQKRLASTANLDTTLAPVLRDAISKLKSYIQSGLPFKTDERLAELTDIESQLAAGTLSASKALARLWAFVEDEIRLTRESGLYRQTVTLDGKDVLADVARIGTVMLFFKADDVTGMATREKGTWAYVPLHVPESRDSVLSFFDSLKKQIRQGYFTLPNALPVTSEAKR